MVEGLGDMGASLSLAAAGSALGTGAAGMAALGAWKKCFIQNKPIPFVLIAFVGAPLSQTIYGMILRNAIKAANLPPESYFWQLLYGLLGGLAMGFSAWMQGRAGANAADAFAETGKGFGNYIMILGVIETVALFVMVFLITAIPKG
jgi:V/A-type H+-transporting ATPase subunit K